VLVCNGLQKGEDATADPPQFPRLMRGTDASLPGPGEKADLSKLF